jgi:ACT domain-containing protein
MLKRAVVTVVGMDKVGIIAGVSGILARHNVNIYDISQTTMQDIFTMIMLVDLTHLDIEYNELADMLHEKGLEIGLQIKVQREEIFQSMHRI